MNAKQTIGIVGCGTMGTGIAIVAARAGFKTRIYDLKPEPLENARKQAAAFLKKSVERGKLADKSLLAAHCGHRANSVRVPCRLRRRTRPHPK